VKSREVAGFLLVEDTDVEPGCAIFRDPANGKDLGVIVSLDFAVARPQQPPSKR
jgi:hypothetical protein